MKAPKCLILTLLLMASLCALCASADGKGLPYPSDWIWGTEAQGWDSISRLSLENKETVVIPISTFSVMMLSLQWDVDPDFSDIWRRIAALGPRPLKEDDKEAFFKWNDEMADVTGSREWSKFWGQNYSAYSPTAENWYQAFIDIRLLKMYELTGYRIVSCFTQESYAPVGSRIDGTYERRLDLFFVMSRE